MYLRFTLACFLFVGTAFVFPLFIYADVDSPTVSMNVVGAWLLIAYSGWKLAVYTVRGDPRLLSLTFWVFVYIWLGVAPFMQFLAGEFPLGGVYSRSTETIALAMVAVGIAAYEVGYSLAGSEKLTRPVLRRQARARVLSIKRTLLLGLFSVGLVLFLAMGLGGLSSLLVARAELTRRIVELVGEQGRANLLIYMTFLRVPVFLSFYLMLYYWIHRRTLGRLDYPAISLMAIGCAGLLNIIANNPLNAPRYWFGTVLMSIGFVLLPWKRNYTFPLVAAGCIVLLLVLFPYADIFRFEIDPERYTAMEWNPIIEKSDYDGFQQLMNTALYVEENGHTFGKQLVGAVLFWFPRGVWRDKPIPTGQLVGRFSGYRSTNLSLPLWGEAFIDGGFVAVALLFVLYGYTLGRLERAFLQKQTAIGTYAALIVPVYAAYQIFLLRGALMSALAYLTPLLVVVYLCTRVSRQDAAEGDSFRRRAVETP